MNPTQMFLVDWLLLRILRAMGDKAFSTTEVRDRYLHHLISDVDRNELRRYLYRELRRLESAGILERYDGSTGRGCKFLYVEEMDDGTIEERISPYDAFVNHPEKDRAEPGASVPETIPRLRDELIERQVELMVCVGEAEEYQRLYKKYPALQDMLRDRYSESRDRSSKLLGQVRAVERLLAELGFLA